MIVVSWREEHTHPHHFPSRRRTDLLHCSIQIARQTLTYSLRQGGHGSCAAVKPVDCTSAKSHPTPTTDAMDVAMRRGKRDSSATPAVSRTPVQLAMLPVVLSGVAVSVPFLSPVASFPEQK